MHPSTRGMGGFSRIKIYKREVYEGRKKMGKWQKKRCVEIEEKEKKYAFSEKMLMHRVGK